MTKNIYELEINESEIRGLSRPGIKGAEGFKDQKNLHSGVEMNSQLGLNHLDVERLRPEHLNRLISHTDPSSPGADRFRLLRTRLRDRQKAGALKSVLVTSPFPGDGKTTVALNLATTLAEEKEKSVLLIDADLHRGSIDDQFALGRHAGLSECLHEGINPMSVIRRVEPLGWHLLSAGKVDVRNPAELLQPERISRIIQQLTSHFDWLFFDCPPVLAVSDALSLVPYVDGSLLVAMAGSTSAKAVEDAVGLIGRKHVIGFVLNGIEKVDQPYGAYYQYQAIDDRRLGKSKRT